MSEETTTPHRTHLPVLPTGRAAQVASEVVMSENNARAADGAAGATPPPQPPVVGATIEDKLLEGKVIAALCTVFDPEIPVNIYELGLIYKIAIDAERNVTVTMTLTAPACPVAGTLPGEVEARVEAVEGVRGATVDLVWDPPWSRDLMSESAMLTLGMM